MDDTAGRAGRAARAGRAGRAGRGVDDTELCYMLKLPLGISEEGFDDTTNDLNVNRCSLGGYVM